MTLDQAIEKAGAALDRILEQRARDLEFQMFADGCTDFDAMASVIAQQREADARWRAQALADLRVQLVDPPAGSPDEPLQCAMRDEPGARARNATRCRASGWRYTHEHGRGASKNLICHPLSA